MADTFSFYGQTWGAGDLDAFIKALNAHGVDYTTWANEHPDAAAILTGPQQGAQQEAVPKSVGEALGAYLATGATPEEAAAAVAPLAQAQVDQGFGAPTGPELVQAAQDVQAAQQGVSPPPELGPPAPATPPPAPAPLTVYNFEELVGLWESNGGAVAHAETAAAIALAESSGDTTAIDNTAKPDKPNYHPPASGNLPEYSVGLWQINIVAHTGLTEAEMLDPDQNAQAAISISGNGASFDAWSTYTSGAYRAFLGGANNPSENIVPPPSAAAVQATNPAGVNAAWGALVDGFHTGSQNTSTKVQTLAASLKEVFTS